MTHEKKLGRLTLTRKLGEKIMIGNDIVITVVDLGHGKVRLGITAPVEIPIHREEYPYQSKQEKMES